VHPHNPTKEYAGVTSVLSARRIDFLEKAKVNGVARYAARNRAQLATYTNQETVYQILRQQDEVLPDWRVAREFGNQVHQVIENIINGRDLDHLLKEVEGTKSYPVDNSFTEWVPKYWDRFVKKHNFRVVSCEESVVSDKWGYGGSYDILGMVDGELAFVDAKSNAKGPSLWSVSMQNKAYAMADYRLDFETGTVTELPPVNKSLVLWMRPEGWNTWPLPMGDKIWKDFYALLWIFLQGKCDGGLKDLEPLWADELIPPRRWGG
jgi:hypothetical protein